MSEEKSYQEMLTKQTFMELLRSVVDVNADFALLAEIAANYGMQDVNTVLFEEVGANALTRSCERGTR